MEAIKINIQIGVTDELYALLKPLVASLQLSPAKSKKETVCAKTDSEPKTELKTESKDELVVDSGAINSSAEEENKEQETVKEYTEVDVRAAMDATRQRIEGEDYKTNTESEGRKNWHRKLTAWFKNTAAIFGADKPSELPDSKSRMSFIACCEAVIIENNELTEPTPF